MQTKKSLNPGIKTLLFIICGITASMIGYPLGIALGVELDVTLYNQYGIGYSNFFSFGGADLGWEGVAMFGSFIGVAIMCIPLISIWFRKSSAKKGWIVFYVGCWLIAFTAQHFYTMATGRGPFFLLLIPIVLTGLLYDLSQYPKKLPNESEGFKSHPIRKLNNEN